MWLKMWDGDIGRVTEAGVIARWVKVKWPGGMIQGVQFEKCRKSVIQENQ